MKGKKFTTYGLRLCLVLLFGSLAVLLWPMVQTPKFWLTVGVVVGMVGSLFFGIASAQNPEE